MAFNGPPASNQNTSDMFLRHALLLDCHFLDLNNGIASCVLGRSDCVGQGHKHQSIRCHVDLTSSSGSSTG